VKEFQIFREGALRIIYERRPGPLTAIVLAARSGSRFDGGSPGIAHLAEHMLFQGTRRRDHQAINREAAELGGDHDAYTGYEELSLTFQVLNAAVPDAIALLAEQVLTSTVPADRLENERNVVAQEIRGHRDDAVSYLADATWQRFFSGGLSHAPSGTLASVRTVGPSRVRRFLAERLVGANVVLSVVGGVAPETVRSAVRREFRRMPRGRELRANGARIAQRGEVRFRRSGLTQLYWTTLLALPSDSRSLVALGIALDVLGTDPDGRLYHEVRERRGLSYDLWADLQSGAGWAVMMVGAVADRRAERRLVGAVEDVFREAVEKGFGDEEIARARRKLAYRYARLAEARLDRATLHAGTVLYGATALTEAEHLVRTLTRAEIEDAWRRAMRGARLTGVLAG
jgi:predicted Zn-dependent peptidase